MCIQKYNSTLASMAWSTFVLLAYLTHVCGCFSLGCRAIQYEKKIFQLNIDEMSFYSLQHCHSTIIHCKTDQLDEPTMCMRASTCRHVCDTKAVLNVDWELSRI